MKPLPEYNVEDPGDSILVLTEYGLTYLHGKNIRKCAMDLIAIAHPKFRPWLAACCDWDEWHAYSTCI
jgi:acyl-CoA hydrolase